MDGSRVRSPLAVFQSLADRLRPYRPRDILAQRTDPQLKLIRGGATLVVAVLLAWLTRVSVAEQSVRDYLAREWPAPAMWSGYLREQGYGRVTEPALLSRLLKSFVPDLDADPSVWTSEDGCQIYLEARPAHGRAEELWTCAPRPERARRWNRLGRGWAAFQKVPELAQKPSKPTRKLSNPIDPLEIRY